MAHSVHKHSTRTRHRVNIVWLENARDPVAQKHGNAFKSFEKNPKMVRNLGHLLFWRWRKLRLRCVCVGSALKKANLYRRRYKPASRFFYKKVIAISL